MISYILLIVTVNCFTDQASANYCTYKETIESKTTQLECDIHVNSSGAWDHIPVGSDEVFEVMLGRKPKQNYEKRFSVSGIGNYDLVIADIQKEDAGTYICRIQHQKEIKRFNLTVLESSPVCSSSMSSESPIAENSCGMQPDTISLSCRVRYSGEIAPVLMWRDIGGHNLSGNTKEGSNTVVNTVHTKASWTDSTFLCETGVKKHSCYFVIPKPLYAFNATARQRIHWPQNASCSANSSQVCSYKWFHDGKEASSEQKLELLPGSPSGEYQCLAECWLHGKYCVVLAHLLTYEFSANNWGSSYVLIYSNIITALSAIFIVYLIMYCSRSEHTGRKFVWKKITKQFWNFRNYILSRICDTDSRSNMNNAELAEGLNSLLDAGIQWATVSPICVKLIEYESTGCGKINGVTVLNNIIYIVRYARHELERYAVNSHEQLDPIRIPQLNEPRDLASCGKTQAVYISDCGKSVVHKLYVENVYTEKWQLKSAPEGLCVLKDGEVLITFPKEHLVRRYTSEGDEIDNIRIPESLINPHHAIMTKANDILICYGKNTDPENGVCSINGAIKFRDPRENNQNMWPTRITETKDGHILVLGFHSQQVLLLTAKMELVEILVQKRSDTPEEPDRMFLDEFNNTLYITENTNKARIFVYKLEDKFHSNQDYQNLSPSQHSDGFNNNDNTPFKSPLKTLLSNPGVAWNNVSPSLLRQNLEYEKAGRGQIKGVTLLAEVLYIVRYAANEIERYPVGEEVEHVHPISIPDLKEPRDLASCAMYDAVYISDCGINGVVHKLFVDNVHTKKWPMKSAPEGLSVLENGDLLVVFPKEKVIRRFNPDGKEISAIRIDDNIVNPHHACLNANNEIVLCYGRKGDREHGVCVVNSNKTFDGTVLNLPDMWPMRVAVTEDGHVLVLSYSSQKILLLNSDLEFVRTLLEGGSGEPDGIDLPVRMFLDEENKRLYVSENIDEARTLSYKLE